MSRRKRRKAANIEAERILREEKARKAGEKAGKKQARRERFEQLVKEGEAIREQRKADGVEPSRWPRRIGLGLAGLVALFVLVGVFADDPAPSEPARSAKPAKKAAAKPAKKKAAPERDWKAEMKRCHADDGCSSYPGVSKIEEVAGYLVIEAHRDVALQACRDVKGWLAWDGDVDVLDSHAGGMVAKARGGGCEEA